MSKGGYIYILSNKLERFHTLKLPMILNHQYMITKTAMDHNSQEGTNAMT